MFQATPGSLVLYFPQSAFVITGDVLFEGSIGRTDLVAGNHQQLIDGIKRKLLSPPIIQRYILDMALPPQSEPKRNPIHISDRLPTDARCTLPILFTTLLQKSFVNLRVKN